MYASFLFILCQVSGVFDVILGEEFVYVSCVVRCVKLAKNAPLQSERFLNRNVDDDKCCWAQSYYQPFKKMTAKVGYGTKLEYQSITSSICL